VNSHHPSWHVARPDWDGPPEAGNENEFVDFAYRWSIRTLTTVTWVSAALFAIYICAFFGGALLAGGGARWNMALPGLYDTRSPVATGAIAAHFLAGAAILVLGPVQLISGVRHRFPALHRWVGRGYLIAAGLAGLGGLAFIFQKGTIGGLLMDVGFGLYGLLVVLCAVQTYAHARAGRYDQHRAWAIRLFALAVGSWLYRMEYGIWLSLAGRVGGLQNFKEYFDAIMVFAFYIPNLFVAEILIRFPERSRGNNAKLGATALLSLASIFVVIATSAFAMGMWGPAILRTFDGPS